MSYPRCTRMKTSFELFLVHLLELFLLLLTKYGGGAAGGGEVCVCESSMEEMRTFLTIMNRLIEDQRYNKSIPHNKQMQFFYHKSCSVIAFFFSLPSSSLRC